jgi:GLPGLI family protein
MKNIKTSFILFLIITAALNTQAQNSGRIVYEQKTKLNINIDSEHEAALANVPKEHVSSRELLFDSTASIFQKEPDKNADETIQQESEHGPMVIKMTEPDDKMYTDLVGKKRLEQRDYMSRKFLIEIPFSASNWKLTGNQKKILNYICQEAILQDTMRKVRAWFTPEIPVSTGPQGICNLPGLILAAEMKGGDVTFEAKSIELKPVDHKQIVKPKEGKKVTRDEFNQMVMEKQKEMDEQGDGNGNMIIRIRK